MIGLINNTPLVSIITPCYNMEKKIIKYLDSILNQTYKNIELILVDDGSTDRTSEIIAEYKERFIDRGISVHYIFKENGGAASAVRKGLDYVNGKYIMWPDADDILMPEAVKKNVAFLECNPQYAFVRTNAYVIDENNFEDRSRLIVKHKNIKRHRIYNECIRFMTYYCPGCYMVRWSDFLEANPDKYIFPTKFGQNIQMLLPIAYKYECGYIDEPLYGYIIYNDSHSRLGGKRTYERKMNYSYNIEEILLNTMKHIGVSNSKDYKKVQDDFCIRRMKTAYDNGNKSDKAKEYRALSFKKKFNPVLLMLRFTEKNKLADFLFRVYEIMRIAMFQLLNRR